MMGLRKFVGLLLGFALIALAWEPAQIYLKGERPILARQVPSLVNPSTEVDTSVGPYGTLSARAFAEEGFQGRRPIQAALTMSSAFAAANPLTSPTTVRLSLLAEDPRIVGVGSVVNEDDLIDLLSYEEPERSRALFFPVDKTGGALSAFSIELRPGNTTEVVNGGQTPQERAVLENLGDVGLWLGAWALQHPDLAVYYDPDTSLGEDLEVPLFTRLPSRPEVKSEVLDSSFTDQVRVAIVDALDKLAGQQRVLASRLIADSPLEPGLFVRTEDGLQPTAEGVAYSLLGRAARPGSLMMEWDSDAVRGAAFRQPDGDVALIAYTDAVSPLEVDIPFGDGVARYSIPLTPGEVNLVVLPPNPA